ncbi:MAG: type II toxin-antitoxin system HicA family toxin [Deltaproteobacteria bacterium]|nr:type II toxin-antitoxin system HicA family toxin [Deltaproteobacteria bacterium]
MNGLNNLDPLRVVKAFERAGWRRRPHTSGSHTILTKAGNPAVLSIPIHKGRPIKQGLLRHQVKTAGMTVEEFLKLYR